VLTLTTTKSANDNDGIADHYSLGLMYSGNGLKAGLGYEKLVALTNAPGAEVDYTMWQLGASYTMNNFSIGAQYEDASDYGFVQNQDYTAWAVTGKASFGNNGISLVYTDSERDPSGSNNEVETSGWGVAAEHNFSKRTMVYAAYATNETDDGTDKVDDDVFSLGMIHNF
jgi:predicted porin